MMPMPLARTYSDEEEDEGTQETEADLHAHHHGHGQQQGIVIGLDRGDRLSVSNSNSIHGGCGIQNGSGSGSGTPNPLTLSGQSRRVLDQVRTFLRTASIEPLLFMFRFAMSITDVMIQGFYLNTICIHNFSQAGVDCSNLTQTIRDEINVIATKYFLYRQILEYGPPILFVLFMGQYVDRNGSKFPMLFAITCSAVSSIIYALLTYIPNLSPSLILLASTPLALGGTFVVFLFAAMKHVASNSSMENRSFRISLAEIIWLIGVPVGLLVALPIRQFLGYRTVFILAAALYLICFIYTIILVKNDIPSASDSLSALLHSDSLQLQANRSRFKCSRSSFSNVVEPLQTCFRKRHGSRRGWLLALLGILFCRFMSMFGDFDMGFLYTRHMFDWKENEYSYYATTYSIFRIIGAIVLSVFSFKILPRSDPIIGLISATTSFIGFVLMACAQYGFMMYLGAAFQMFSILITTIVRSLTSKIVAKQEIGKIFSIIASFECLIPLIAAVVFNNLFKVTQETFAGAAYALCSLFTMLAVILYGYLAFSMRGQQLHQEMEGHPPGVQT